jgi:hypothetical protein
VTDSLWEFAFTRYERAGVAELCLELQDELDADINMLLAAACTQWRTLCLLPLRRIRRDLKGLPGAEGWYARLKALELEAERQQLHRMEEMLRPSIPVEPATAGNLSAIIEANLSGYLELLHGKARHRPEVAALLTRLLTAQ